MNDLSCRAWTPMRRPIRSYVPERQLLEGKQSPVCRPFFEDVALLEAGEEGRILAFRGRDLAVGESFFSTVGVAAEEMDFLFSALATDSRVLIRSARGPVLVFGDVLFTACRMLAVLPHCPFSELSTALSMLARREIVSSVSCGVCTACAPDEEICRRLAELFFDLDRIFNNRRVRSFSDYLRLIFEFSGASPSRRPEVPSQMPATPTQMDCLAMDYLEECLRRR